MDTTNGESSQRHRQDNDIAFYSTSNNVLQDSAYPPHLYGTQSSRNARDASLAFGEPTQIDIHNAMEQYSQLSHSLGTESTDRELVELEEGVTPGKFEYLMRILNSRLEEQRSRGVIEKRLGVSFRNLTVLGNSSKVQHIQTVWSPILHAIRIAKNLAQRRLRPTPGEPVRILHNISGFCADGEMVLVLGVPGSGCSTLLRVLANRRKSYKEIHGEVSYHGISANEMAKKYRGEVAYNQEEDDHYPMLTVKQTLEFAGQCRKPSKNVFANPERFVDELLAVIISTLGLSHCANTPVGNEQIRGVSGGERKRVSIAEQAIARAPVSIWDGSTKGLDAATALDFVRALRIGTNVLGRATIVSLYQASESIYELFDKVMVLADGYCIYFGPTSGAKAYFERLGLYCPPRMTTPDFLTSVTQLEKREIQSGFVGWVPSSAEEFAECFDHSLEKEMLIRELDAYENRVRAERADVCFRRAITQERHKHAGENLPYVTSYHHQLLTCLIREYNLTRGSLIGIGIGLAFNAFLAIIVGSLFYKLPLDVEGAFARGGALFFSALLNVLSAQSELPKSFFGRTVLYKHKQLALYRPSAYYIAQVLASIPISILNTGLFSVLVYWMVGLRSTAEAFFTFFFVVFIVNMCLIAFYRMISILSPNIEVANLFAGTFLLAFILYSGYLIPLKSMRPWFIWIRYINPVAWALDALVINEFKDLVFTCAPPFLVPFGSGYGNIANQACNIEGATPGTNRVLGANYISEKFSSNVGMLWPNIVIALGFWLLYVVITCIGIEKLDYSKGGYTVKVYKAKKPKVPQRSGQVAQLDSRESSQVQAMSDEQVHNIVINESSDYMQALNDVPIFMWHSISYTIKSGAEEKKLLNNITGWVRSGELVALMGSSGAGKTTLLDVLAQRKSVGRVTGDIRLKMRHPGPDFNLLTGYCEQMDVHNACATVRETIRFSAYMRQPEHVSKEEKDRDVERIISLLGLEEIGDALIGSAESGKGISLEERKRVSIAIELAAKPTILFLDEPTSGLDSQASLSLVMFLRQLARQGQAIICTIHQPSSILFEKFDRLLLLARGGETVYFGDIGEDSQTVISYFERNGAEKCPKDGNPAEYILDTVGAEVASRSSRDWSAIWRESHEAQEIWNKVESYMEICRENDEREGADNFQGRGYASTSSNYPTSYTYQIIQVTRRMMLNYWRMPTYNVGRLLHQIIVALVLGFTFYRLDFDLDDLTNRSFAVFEMVILGVLVVNDVIPQYFVQLGLFLRENSAGYYSWAVFATAMILTEIPFVVVNSTIFFLLNYYLTNFNPMSGRTIYFYLIYITQMIYAATFGLAVASATPHPDISMLISGMVVVILSLFSGVTIKYDNIPVFWRDWIYWINPYHYAIEGVLTNDIGGMPTHCIGSQFITIEPPGTTCGDYLGSFLQREAGYVDNPSATSGCRYCPYRVGDEFFSTFSWDFSHRWRNFAILFAFIAGNLAVNYISMYRYRQKGQKMTFNEPSKSTRSRSVRTDSHTTITAMQELV